MNVLKYPEKKTNSIDAFIETRLKEEGIAKNKSADPLTLIRRVSVVLTGLPAQPSRVVEFLSDYKKNPTEAYNELVAELLASPHFGERWAQHWLDVIRWAETNGS